MIFCEQASRNAIVMFWDSYVPVADLKAAKRRPQRGTDGHRCEFAEPNDCGCPFDIGLKQFGFRRERPRPRRDEDPKPRRQLPNVSDALDHAVEKPEPPGAVEHQSVYSAARAIRAGRTATQSQQPTRIAGG